MLNAARNAGASQWIISTAADAATLVHAQGHPGQVRLLLDEIDRLGAARADPAYATVLPGLVRTAIALHNQALAASLTDGVPPLTPLQQHALASSRAQLTEAAGNSGEAAVLYANAAQRWHLFGNLPERAYALLGQGRCLHTLDDPAADQPLSEARDLFATMGYQPALTETRTLLDQAHQAAS